MGDGWALAGYDVEQLIGFGATGEVWRARERASGAVVALKRLRADVDPAAISLLRREAAVLGSLADPHLLRLRGLVAAGDELVLVLDHAAGGSLAAILSTRGVIAPGEAVTMAAPLAATLGVVHASGLVHGDVSPGNVLFTADGRPLLADLGVARLRGDADAEASGAPGFVAPEVLAGEQSGAAADVFALAAVCHAALAGQPPRVEVSGDGPLRARTALPSTLPVALAAAVAAGLAARPEERPAPSAFGLALRDAVAAQPVRLVPVGAPRQGVAVTHQVRPRPTPPRPAVHRRDRAKHRAVIRRTGRRVLAGLAASATLVAAVLVGVAWAARDRPHAGGLPVPGALRAGGLAVTGRAGPPAPAPQRPPPVTAAELRRLEAARVAALTQRSRALLSRVYTPTSPAFAADDGVIARLRAAGWRPVGLHATVETLLITRVDAGHQRVRVVEQRSGYRVVAATGRVVQRVPPRSRRLSLLLTAADTGWRVSEVLPDG